MNAQSANRRAPRQEARMVMHEDERRIIKAMLSKALGNDDWFGMVVSGDRSESGRAEDRLVLARFLARMERQFELRANGRRHDPRVEHPTIELPSTLNGTPRAAG